MALESKRVLPGLRGREGRRGLGEEPLRVAEFPSTLPLVGPRVPRAPCAPLPGRCVPQVKAEGCFSARLTEPSQRLRACVRACGTHQRARLGGRKSSQGSLALRR